MPYIHKIHNNHYCVHQFTVLSFWMSSLYTIFPHLPPFHSVQLTRAHRRFQLSGWLDLCSGPSWAELYWELTFFTAILPFHWRKMTLNGTELSLLMTHISLSVLVGQYAQYQGPEIDVINCFWQCHVKMSAKKKVVVSNYTLRANSKEVLSMARVHTEKVKNIRFFSVLLVYTVVPQWNGQRK